MAKERDRQSMATSTSLVPSVVAQVAGMLRGKQLPTRRQEPTIDWFGPQQPMSPVAPPEVKGRQFDYPYGVNLRRNRQAQEGGVDYWTLRQLADSFDVLRGIIENLKDKLAAMPWKITTRDEDLPPDQRCADLTAFFNTPMPGVFWADWLRMILEEAMVIDAVALYPRFTNGGAPWAVELIDGATITRILAQDGRVPMPPDPAYQQQLKGMPAVDYTADELLFRVRNPRVWKIYGYSKVEQIIVSVNIALRRQAFVLDYYTSGSIPDSVFSVPEDWTPGDVKAYQEYFDDLLSGEGAEKRKMRFVPPGTYQATKDPNLKDAFDEWLARICCFIFGVSPTPFVAQVNRATAESEKARAHEDGVTPWRQFIKQLMDQLICVYFKMPDLCFSFDVKEEIDPKTQCEMDDKNIRNGSTTINEVREKRGDDPVDGGDKPFIVLTTGPLLLTDIEATSDRLANPPTPPAMGAGGDDPAGGKGNPPPQPGAPPVAKKRLKAIDRERPAIVKARGKIEKHVSKILKECAASVAAHLSKKIGVEKADSPDDIAKAVDLDVLAKMVDTMQDDLAGVASDGAEEALLQVGKGKSRDALNLANKRAEVWAEDHAAELVKGITDVTRDKLAGLIKDAIDGGWSPQQVTKEIQEAYAFSEERAEVIARTEVARADVAGNLAGYRASGVVSKKVWLTANDDLVSEDCVACQQQGPIPLDETFVSGEQGPPDHPNCRCDIAPVLDDDDSEKANHGHIHITVPVTVAPAPKRTVEKTVVERDANGLVKRSIEKEL